MRHVSSGQRSWIHSRKTPSHLVFVIFVTDEGDSRQLDQTMLAVRTTHSRVAQGAQTIHSLWNLRLTQVTNRTNRIFLAMLFHKIVPSLLFLITALPVFRDAGLDSNFIF